MFAESGSPSQLRALHRRRGVAAIAVAAVVATAPWIHIDLVRTAWQPISEFLKLIL